MKSAKLLIDMARHKVQTDAALAAALRMPPSNFSALKAGKRHLTDAQVAALCDLLQLSGDEAREWLAVVAVERAQEGSRGLLRRAFFVCWVGLVGAAQIGAPTDAMARTGTTRRLDEGSLAARCLDGLHIVAGCAGKALAQAVAAFSRAGQWVRPTASSAKALAKRIRTA